MDQRVGTFDNFHIISLHSVFQFLFSEKIKQTVKIDASSVEIEERGVKLRLTVVDTPGFGDSLNTEDWYVWSQC